MDNPEQKVIEKILAGHPEDFASLVDRYKKRLFNYIYRMISHYDTALELTQDVFLKAYASLDKYDPSYRFSTWIFRIATNTAIDHLRKSRGYHTSIDQPLKYNDEESLYIQLRDPGDTPQETLEQRETTTVIEKAIARLPEKYKQLIILRHVNDCSYGEISEITGLPLGTVKNRIFRAREALRLILEEQGDLT
jgi:RNA polymerase sigma-70 factor (ECF subfamily)